MEIIQPTVSLESGTNQEKNNNMATKSTTKMSRGRKTDPPSGTPKPLSLKVSAPDFSPKVQRPQNYNYQDAMKRSGSVGKTNQEMSKLRQGFTQQRKASARMEQRGETPTFTREAFRDSIASTLPPGRNLDNEVNRLAGSKRVEMKTAKFMNKTANPEYTGKAAHKAATKKKKQVGTAGPGVNLCKSKSMF